MISEAGITLKDDFEDHYRQEGEYASTKPRKNANRHTGNKRSGWF